MSHCFKFIFLIVLLLPLPGVIKAQSADEIRSELADRYEKMGSMGATFVQVATSDFMDAPERFSGTMIFSGSKYRIQTDAQTIVTDGETLWIHNFSEKQVIINDFVNDAASFSLTSFLSQFDKNYTAAFFKPASESSHYFLKLTPQDDLAQFRSVELEVRRPDLIITGLKVIDLNDVQMDFVLSSIVVNPSITDATFTFQAPPNTEVIDLRN